MKKRLFFRIFGFMELNIVRKMSTIFIISFTAIFIYWMSGMSGDGSSMIQPLTSMYIFLAPFAYGVMYAAGSFPNKKWKMINGIFTLFVVISSLFLTIDYWNRPFQHDFYKNNMTITETNTKYVFETESKNIFYCDKDKIKSDSLNPIKMYKSYKNDIFGKKGLYSLVVKTDLMSDYVNLENK